MANGKRIATPIHVTLPDTLLDGMFPALTGISRDAQTAGVTGIHRLGGPGVLGDGISTGVLGENRTGTDVAGAAVWGNSLGGGVGTSGTSDAQGGVGVYGRGAALAARFDGDVEIAGRLRVERGVKHARYYWGRRNGTLRFEFTWDAIRHDSVVLISASEGHPPIATNAPERFVGAARFTVLNIAPWDGGVTFGVAIDWDDPLGLWTDITVFASSDELYQPPSRYVDV